MCTLGNEISGLSIYRARKSPFIFAPSALLSARGAANCYLDNRLSVIPSVNRVIG